MEGSRERRKQLLPRQGPLKHGSSTQEQTMQDTRCYAPSLPEAGPNCPEVSGNKDSLAQSPTQTLQKINLLTHNSFVLWFGFPCTYLWTAAFQEAQTTLKNDFPAMAETATCSSYPISSSSWAHSETASPRIPCSQALRCSHVTECCPMNCR